MNSRDKRVKCLVLSGIKEWYKKEYDRFVENGWFHSDMTEDKKTSIIFAVSRASMLPAFDDPSSVPTLEEFKKALYEEEEK